MRFYLTLCVALLCGVGAVNPALASDWAESSEVRSRLDQLKARPKKAAPSAYVDELTDQVQGSPQKTVKPWRNVTYDAIAPTELPKKPARGQGRSIEVAEADKLGYQLNNAEMRNKVLELYRRPDIVVEQYVIGQ